MSNRKFYILCLFTEYWLIFFGNSISTLSIYPVTTEPDEDINKPAVYARLGSSKFAQDHVIVV